MESYRSSNANDTVSCKSGVVQLLECLFGLSMTELILSSYNNMNSLTSMTTLLVNLKKM